MNNDAIPDDLDFYSILYVGGEVRLGDSIRVRTHSGGSFIIDTPEKLTDVLNRLNAWRRAQRQRDCDA